MAKESKTTPTKATSPQPSSPKTGTNSKSTDCKESSSKPFDKTLNPKPLQHVKPQREIDTPINASNRITVEKASIASSHEKISESESTSPDHAPADATTGTSTTQIELKTKPKRDLEPEGEMSSEMHPVVVAFESELALENSIILDALLVNQEMGLQIPFDVTSYPVWNNLREVEDQLYWAMKAVGPRETPCDDQWW